MDSCALSAENTWECTCGAYVRKRNNFPSLRCFSCESKNKEHDYQFLSQYIYTKEAKLIHDKAEVMSHIYCFTQYHK